jgi:hypothetical protein
MFCIPCSEFYVLRSMSWVLCSAFCALSSMFCIPCSEFYVLRSVLWVLCSAFCALSTMFRVPCSELYVLRSMFWVLCSAFRALSSMFCILCSEFYVLRSSGLSSMFCVLCSEFNVLRSMFCVLLWTIWHWLSLRRLVDSISWKNIPTLFTIHSPGLPRPSLGPDSYNNRLFDHGDNGHVLNTSSHFIHHVN